jgi:hypothetical protein
MGDQTPVGAADVLLTSGVIGSEFPPHLDEGAIWRRGSRTGCRSRTWRRTSSTPRGEETSMFLRESCYAAGA